ncbi:MAG: hypothetical protein HY420_03065 [Candidatus Kerfeldbacteria bacterium]|nr:hypothetical protein [Candidatus Kerfeldbacteria bacterium]
MSVKHQADLPKGQGLLETVIGIGVIIAGTIGSVTLIAATVTAGRATNNKVIAASLAREGIEAVRNIRDANWLRIQANEDTDLSIADIQLPSSFDGLYDQTSNYHVAVPGFSWAGNSWTVGSVPDPAMDFNDTNSFTTKMCGKVGTQPHVCSEIYQEVATQAFYQTDKGFSASVPPATRFKRLVNVNPICREDDAPADGIPDVGFNAAERIEALNGSTCSATEILVGLQVISKVCWDDCTAQKTFQLEDRLYNWKYVK